jgi:hypothetical protein
MKMKSSGKLCVESVYPGYIAIYWKIAKKEFQLRVPLAFDHNMRMKDASEQQLFCLKSVAIVIAKMEGM